MRSPELGLIQNADKRVDHIKNEWGGRTPQAPPLRPGVTVGWKVTSESRWDSDFALSPKVAIPRSTWLKRGAEESI